MGLGHDGNRQGQFDAGGNTGSNSKPSKLHPHTAPEHDSHNFYTTTRHGPACGGADQVVVAHVAHEMCRAVGKLQNLEAGGEVEGVPEAAGNGQVALTREVEATTRWQALHAKYGLPVEHPVSYLGPVIAHERWHEH